MIPSVDDTIGQLAFAVSLPWNCDRDHGPRDFAIVWGYGEDAVDVLFDVAEGWEKFQICCIGPHIVFGVMNEV
jgi:hypothetical protein